MKGNEYYSFLLQHCCISCYICRMKTKPTLLILLFASLTIVSCKKDEPETPEIPNEEELITTLSVTLTPDGGGDTVTLTFQDLDGDGGNDPDITVSPLAANTQYSATVELLNETENPAEDITEEVEGEAEEHQFFYMTIEYADADGNGQPIGLATVISTGDAESGTFTITLRHEPDKDAAGVEDGDISNAGGETDIEVTFDIEVE
jgi:hypothetical protein